MFLTSLINHSNHYPERFFIGNKDQIRLAAFELSKPYQSLSQINTQSFLFLLIGMMTAISSIAIYKFIQLKHQFKLKLDELHYLQNSLDIKVQERIGDLESIITKLETRLQQQQPISLDTHSQKCELMSKVSKGLAHNINNLLTGVIGNINITLETLTPDQSQYLLKSRDAAIRASGIITDLLDIVESECNDHSLTSINEVLHDVIKTTPMVDQPVIELLTHFKTDLPHVLIDQNKVKTAFTHLIQNAQDAILNLWEKIEHFPHRQDDSFCIKIKTDIAQYPILMPTDVTSDQTFVEISIHDNGIGMTPDIKEQIFDPFFTTKATVGTGLGLVGTEKIIKNHQGWIHFESQHGMGSVFTILIPVDQSMR